MIVDLFAGLGGWHEGLRTLGHTSVGVELDRDACATSQAAGHPTLRADLTSYPAEAFRGATGLIASPPCQDFSTAGKQVGRTGERGRLIDIVPAWIDVLRPEWICCEQVPPCLDIWKEHAYGYRRRGYSTWTGILNAANFGVPQTRQRAILIASRVRSVTAPEPTHAKDPQDGLFGTLQPWVTMAEALGWGLSGRPGFTYCGGNEGGPDLAGGSGARAALQAEREAGNWVQPTISTRGDSANPANEFDSDRPSWALTGKARSWTVNTGRDWKPGGTREDAQTIDCMTNPAPLLTTESGGQWQLNPGRTDTQPNRRTYSADEPAPVVAFGHDAANWCWEQADDNPIRLTVNDALILQGFRPDYPVQGSRTSKFLQIGNAICPPLAAPVLAVALGLTMEAAA